MAKRIFLSLLVMVCAMASAENVPYSTSFDNTYNEYDGTSFLPVGWLMTGDNPFYTANMNELHAADGTYYLVSQNNTASPRNEHLYTPLFHMEKGRTYIVSYELYMPGLYYAYLDDNNHYAEASHHPTHRLTVGEEQDYEFHTLHDPLITITDSLSAEWHKQIATFTPEATGDYCFCMAFESQETYHGDVAIDDFCVTYEGAVLKPTVDFSHGGMYNLMNSTLVDFEGGGVNFTGIMTHTTGCEWTVKDDMTGEIIATSTETSPRFYFPETSNYTVSLTGYNSEYSVTVKKPIVVEFIGTEGAGFLPMYTYGEDVTTIYKANYSPVIGLDDPQDFATGPNHTYKKFAERIELPENVTLTLQTLQYFLSQCSFASQQSGSIRTAPFTFSIYGETDGLPDESKLLWRKKVTMNDAFSTNVGGLGAATQLSRSLENTKVSGTFYIAFEFEDDFPIDPWNQGGERHVIEMTSCQHHDQVARLFYKELATGKWHRIDYFNPGLAGFGLNLVVWCSAAVSPSAIDEIEIPHFAQPETNYDLFGRHSSINVKGIKVEGGKKVVR